MSRFRSSASRQVPSFGRQAASPVVRPAPAPVSPAPADLIEIGHLTRAHGLKGEIALSYYAESLEWLNEDVWLRAGENKAARPVKICAFRAHHGQLLIQLDGVTDRSAAEVLRGMTVLIPESRLPESDEESLYLHDLIGLNVVLHENGAAVGRLTHVDFNGEQELWTIESPEGREILFPAVPEFVDDIDLSSELVRISPPPGLLELYAAD